MQDVSSIEGRLVVEGPTRIAIISARFNSFIVSHLESGCVDTLQRHGVASADIKVVRVPGAFEIPVVAARLAQSAKYDAVIALGAVIRGATAHFDHVAGACSRGLASVATDSGVPIVFGVLTVDNIEQAIERAGTKAGNKGAESAVTAIEMISLLRQL